MRPVADLVAQHGLQLGHGHLLDKRVEEHDALVLAEAEEVRVAVAAALAAVDLVELRQREV